MSHNVAAADGFKGLANEPRGVMKGRNEFNLRVVDGGWIDGYVRSRWQATEEIHDAATPNHSQRLLPRRGIPGGFDDGIRPAPVIGQGPHRRDDLGCFRYVDRGDRA